LVVNQLNKEYEIKDDTMAAYVCRVLGAAAWLSSFEVIRIPQSKIRQADAL